MVLTVGLVPFADMENVQNFIRPGLFFQDFPESAQITSILESRQNNVI